MDGKLKGHAALWVANIIWGLNAPIGKSVLWAETHPQGVSPFALSVYRMLGACRLFWTASLFLPREKVAPRDIVLLLFASVFGIQLNQMLFLWGLSLTSPIDTSIIATIVPVLTMVLATLFLREPITWLKAGGVLLGCGGALLLILVIQGSIWINFSFPTITGKYLFFLGYLIVSSIQMGANIDYAIVIASRYQELKGKMPHKNAMIETLNFAFPTIITSGAIMSICGFLIGSMTSEPGIAGIGESLGRGPVISIFLVMFVLPQILLVGSGVVDRTSFSVPAVSVGDRKSACGLVVLIGMVRGHFYGSVRGILRATVDGDVDLNVVSGSAGGEEADQDEQ